MTNYEGIAMANYMMDVSSRHRLHRSMHDKRKYEYKNEASNMSTAIWVRQAKLIIPNARRDMSSASPGYRLTR